MKIRKVDISDATKICDIYNFYVVNSIATFDEENKDVDFFYKKIKDTIKNYPWLVVEDNNEVIGFAYASMWKDKSAYSKSVESTIYIDNKFTKKSIGSELYMELINELTNMGFKSVVGIISIPNVASEILHERLGFKKVAHFSKIGTKFGEDIDVACWQLLI